MSPCLLIPSGPGAIHAMPIMESALAALSLFPADAEWESLGKSSRSPLHVARNQGLTLLIHGHDSVGRDEPILVRAILRSETQNLAILVSTEDPITLGDPAEAFETLRHRYAVAPAAAIDEIRRSAETPSLRDYPCDTLFRMVSDALSTHGPSRDAILRGRTSNTMIFECLEEPVVRMMKGIGSEAVHRDDLPRSVAALPRIGRFTVSDTDHRTCLLSMRQTVEIQPDVDPVQAMAAHSALLRIASLLLP